VLDLLIRGGTVVDGSGAPGRRADLAIADGKVVAIGAIDQPAHRAIDADGLIVAPGFVDPHTHYDAQICWDRSLTSSPWHGVTTVVMGNCGVGIAPVRPEAREIVTWDLVNIEGIPFDVLDKGIDWDWQSFPDYLAAARRRGSGINLAFLAPLTPFRHYVMGEASMDRAATPAEAATIAGLLGEAMEAGAIGWSTTIGRQHVGYKGRPIACRLADRAELSAYANVLKRRGKGTIQIALTRQVGYLLDDERALLDFLLTESGRPVTWSFLMDRHDIPNAASDTLDQIAPLIARGGIPQFTPLPVSSDINLKRPFLFSVYPSWKPALNAPVEDQLALLRSAAFRTAFRDELAAAPMGFTGDWSLVEIGEVAKPTLKPLEGRTIADIAGERGVDPFDLFFDIAVDDGLDSQFTFTLFNVDEDRVARLVNDPRVVVGLSDAGAHVDMHDNAGYGAYLLGRISREMQAMTLERAVQRLTSEPARLFGLDDRGLLAPGLPADVVIFDYATIGPKLSPIHNQEVHRDLPGNGKRLVWPQDAAIRYTIVNGEVLYEAGQYQGGLPGRVVTC
jgi:N-acyl-D-amino-acid deacylase